MKLKSLTTVIIRIIGMLCIVYCLTIVAFLIIAMAMLGGMPIWANLLAPIVILLFGVTLISASRSLAGTLCRGLED